LQKLGVVTQAVFLRMDFSRGLSGRVEQIRPSLICPDFFFFRLKNNFPNNFLFESAGIGRPKLTDFFFVGKRAIKGDVNQQESKLAFAIRPIAIEKTDENLGVLVSPCVQ
jgi:hypothetical protein